MNIIVFFFKMFYFFVKGVYLIFIEVLWNYVCLIYNIVGEYLMFMLKLLKVSWRLKVDRWYDLFIDMYNDFLMIFYDLSVFGLNFD